MTRISSLVFLLVTALVLGGISLGTFAPNFSLQTYLYPERQVVCVVGDVMLARNVEVLMNRNGASYPYQYQTFCPSESPFVANFEASIPEIHKPTPSGSFTFSVRERFLPALQAAGMSHLSLANNHTDDFGSAGLLQTQATLAEVGFETAANYDFVIVDADAPIAFVMVDITLAPLDGVQLQTAMEAARTQSEVQVVYIHWGPEYALEHDVAQAAVAEQLVASGADLVIGHHPHVVQDIDIVDGVPVIYSLGNYIFDQYFSDDVQTGLALTLSYTDSWEILLHPVETLSFKSAPRSMDAIARSTFLEELASRSHPAIQEQIRSGYIRL